MKSKICYIFLFILFHFSTIQAQMPKHFTLKFINQKEVKIQFLSKSEREKLIKKHNGNTDLPKELTDYFEQKLSYGSWGIGGRIPTIQSIEDFDSLALELEKPTDEEISLMKEKLKDPFDKKVIFLDNKQVIKTHLGYNQKEEIYILFNSFTDFEFATEYSHIHYNGKKLDISTFWHEKPEFDSLIQIKKGIFLDKFSNKHYKSYSLNDGTFVCIDFSNNSHLYFNQNDLKKYFLSMNTDYAKSYQVNVENRIIKKKLFISKTEIREVSLIPYQQIDALKKNRKAQYNNDLSDKMSRDYLYDLDNEEVLVISGVDFNNFGILMKKADLITYLPNSNWKILTDEDRGGKPITNYDKFYEYGEDFPKYTQVLIQDLLDFLKIEKQPQLNDDLWGLIWDRLEEYLSNDLLFNRVFPNLLALQGELQILREPDYYWKVDKKSINPEFILKDGKMAELEKAPYYYIPYTTNNNRRDYDSKYLYESLQEVGWGYINRDYED